MNIFKSGKKYLYFVACIISASFGDASEKSNNVELTEIFHQHCIWPCDINEHVLPLSQLASECTSVAEIGIRSVVSTWGVLKGLSEVESPNLFYLGIDLDEPPLEVWQKAERLARASGIDFHFWKANDMTIDLPNVDMLFIDSLHTYCHLTYELEKFSGQVNKYIAMHDTSAPWGTEDDHAYGGNYSEYSSWIDKTKKGLWAAVVDFLHRHPEWTLHERRLNNHGFTVLRRVGPNTAPVNVLKVNHLGRHRRG
jgi:hypothetical protein